MHVRNSEVRTYDLLRKSVLRSFRMRKARLDVSPKPREARADQERLRRPPGAFATWQAAGEKHPQPPAQALGSFLGVKAKPLRGRGKPRALTPSLRQCPSSPCAGLWRVFRVKGGSRGWCGPQPRRGRTRPLDATGRPKPAGRVSGALFPRHPCPLGEAPAGSPEGAMSMRCGGTPCRGSRGAQPLGPAQRTKKPSAEGEHFLLFELRFWLFKRPQKGPDLQIQKGERRKLDLARVCED